jgi:hypothetical protein
MAWNPEGAARQMKIMRGMYGPLYHAGLVQEWRDLQESK